MNEMNESNRSPTTFNWPPKWLQRKSKTQKRSLLAIPVVLVFLITFYSFYFKSTIPDFGWNGTYTPDPSLDVQGVNAAVVSDSSICSEMGLEILKQGGTAADAAVQVCLCIGSVTPNAAGIGGGGFILHRFPNGTTDVIDARDFAPNGASKHMFDNNPLLSKIGGLASGVPGEVAGLEALWKLGGSMNWKDLVNPVADMNLNGVPRSEHLIKATSDYFGLLAKMYPGVAKDMLNKSDWGWLVSDPLSETFTRPNLAKTLYKIADEGAKAFYHGDIPKSLSKISKELGGILTEEDFNNYEVIFRKPINTTFLNKTVLTTPEPTSGPALLLGLNVLDKYLNGIYSEKLNDYKLKFDDPDVIQVIVETMKWIAAARSELGDPDFIDNEKIAQINTDEWASNVLSNISINHTLPSWRSYHPSYEMNNPQGTTHFSIVDKYGGAVTMTSTVNLPFGSLICDPETGVILNNEMDDFSIPQKSNSFDLAPSIYNFIVPGKRSLSSAVPNIIFNEENELEFVGGAAGGSKILTSTFLTIIRAVGFELPTLEAISFPRFHHQLIPEVLYFENNTPKESLRDASLRGHTTEYMVPASTVNVIHKRHGVYHAVGDFYRKRAIGAAY